jgi:phosphate transport system substrate-binding protein
MGILAWCAAGVAALLIPAVAVAQDVTLTAREGGIRLEGTLQSFDGEFYRIDTSYGLLTVDGQGVICTGPGCPDLTAPKAVIRITGAPDAGVALIPPLFRSFAAQRGLIYQPVFGGGGYAAILADPETGKTLAEISFAPAAPDAALAAMAEGQADLIVAAAVPDGVGHQALAMDALIPIMAADNPTPSMTTRDLAGVLGGEIDNWQDVGGPDMPIALHALNPDLDLQRALSARLGREIKATNLHPDLASLAAAVANDPYALAITGQATQGAAQRLLLTDSCGYALTPTPLSVKADDYPLSLPIFVLTPPRRLPLLTREFLEFLATPAAQATIATAGYVDRGPTAVVMSLDGQRMDTAIKGAGDETTLKDLQDVVQAMTGAARLSLTFRFDDTGALDANSQQNLTDLGQLLLAGQFANQTLVLAGFSDGQGEAAENLTLSVERAEAVLGALREAAPDVPAGALPVVQGYGEVLPIACDATTLGRQINRRVELWVRAKSGL